MAMTPDQLTKMSVMTPPVRPNLMRQRHNLVTSASVQASRKKSTQGESFLIRESSEYDAALLLGMASQVLTPWLVSIPALVDLLDKLPRLVLRNAEGVSARAIYGGVIDVCTTDGRWAGWHIPVGDDHVLVFPASAAHLDEDDQNVFTEAFTHWVMTHRPAHVRTGPFSRMGRRKSQLELIRRSFERIGAKFSCQEAQDLNPGDAMGGGLMWTMLASQSEAEWLSIVKRNFAGRIYALKSDRYPVGNHALPEGYTKVDRGEDRGRLVPQPDQWSFVNAMLVAAASTDDASVLVKHWGDIGVTRRKWRKTDFDLDDDITSMVLSPGLIVKARLARLDVYEYGVLTTVLRSPLPPGQAQTIHGIDVMVEAGKEDTDPGRVFIDVAVGLPSREVEAADGTTSEVVGWADQEVFDAIRKNWAPDGWCGACGACCGDVADLPCERSRERGKRGDAGRILSVLPSWMDAGLEYRFARRNSKLYYLMRRDPKKAKGGWLDDASVEVIGGGDSCEIYNTLAEMLVGPASDAYIEGGSYLSAEDVTRARERLAELDAVINEATGAASVLRASAQGADATAAETLHRVADDKDTAVAVAQAEMADVTAVLNAEVPVDSAAMADGSTTLALSALLRTLGPDDLVPGPVRRRLAHILDGTFRVRADGFRALSLEACLRLPCVGPDGESRLGVVRLPVSGEVPNRLMRENGTSMLPGRVAEAFEVFMTTDVTREQVANTYGWDPTTFSGLVIDHLRSVVPTAGAASALLLCPIPETRGVLWEAARSTARPEVAADIDEAFATIITSTFFDPAWSRRRGWVDGNATLRRRVLAYFITHREEFDDRGVAVAELVEVFDIKNRQMVTLYGTGSPLPGVVVKTDPFWRHARGDHRFVTPRRCPHCASEGVEAFVDHWLLVSELWDAGLCSRCRRMPSRLAVFPAGYLRLWAGAHAAGGEHRVGTVEEVLAPTPLRPRHWRGRIIPRAS